VARSRIMICLWSRQYFGSDWCKAELAQMLARRQAVGGVPLRPLIVAAVIHDGKQLPRELSFQVRDLAEHAGHAIEKAPPLDEAWQGLAVTAFEGLFTARQGQYAVPSLGGTP
jgi:hypothetical protein